MSDRMLSRRTVMAGGAAGAAAMVMGMPDAAMAHPAFPHTFHDITAHHHPVSEATPFQIMHDGNIMSARAMNYLIIKALPTRIELELKRMADAVNLEPGTTLWQTDRNAPAKIAFTPGATSVGTHDD